MQRAINKNAIKLKLKENMNKLNNNNKSNIEKIEVLSIILNKLKFKICKSTYQTSYYLFKIRYLKQNWKRFLVILINSIFWTLIRSLKEKINQII